MAFDDGTAFLNVFNCAIDPPANDFYSPLSPHISPREWTECRRRPSCYNSPVIRRRSRVPCPHHSLRGHVADIFASLSRQAVTRCLLRGNSFCRPRGAQRYAHQPPAVRCQLLLDRYRAVAWGERGGVSLGLCGEGNHHHFLCL